jgi:hypothetical protein
MASNITVDTLTKGSTTLNTDEIVDTNSSQVCKAWVNFNGSGTVAIRDSFNVSSITDLSVGHYNANFTSNLSDVNYSVSGSASSPSTRYGNFLAPANGTKSVSSVGMRTEPSHIIDTGYDHTEISVQIFSN